MGKFTQDILIPSYSGKGVTPKLSILLQFINSDYDFEKIFQNSYNYILKIFSSSRLKFTNFVTNNNFGVTPVKQKLELFSLTGLSPSLVGRSRAILLTIQFVTSFKSLTPSSKAQC